MWFTIIIFLILSIGAAVLGASVIIGLIMTRGVPFISTPRKDFDEILRVAEVKPGELVYDLGCGRGHFLIRAVKKFKARGVGYELSLWPYLWAKLHNILIQTKIKFYLKNFFKADLSNADVVFCYLFPEIMAKLEDKFKKELKPGARVVSYGFHLPNIEPKKTIVTNDDKTELGRIFVYRF